MKKGDYIWMNGEFVAWEDAKVHVLTHALHYGSGVFEGIRAYKTERGTAIFRHKEHLDRLHRSADLYSMEVPYTTDELREATHELIARNGFDSCYIRPLAFRGYGEMGLNPLKAPVEVVIAVWQWGAYLGEDGHTNGVRAMISSWKRISPSSLIPQAKACGQYLNSSLAKVETVKEGYDEAILLDERENVCEGTGENIFIVKDGKISTPTVDSSILPGITRDSAMRIANDLGYEVAERDIGRDELFAADEVFMTGTAAEVVPIREIDDREIGPPGPVTKAIQSSYFDAIYARGEKYLGWLDFVEMGAESQSEGLRQSQLAK